MVPIGQMKMSKPIILHFISSLEQGGAQAVLYQLVCAMHEYEHHVVFIHSGVYEKQFQDLNVSLYQIQMYQLIALCLLLKKIKPVCMHTSLWAANWLGRIAAKIMGIACVSCLHNHAELNGKVRHLFDIIAPQPSRFIAVSREVKASFGYAQITVIKNGIEIYDGKKKTKAAIGLMDHHFVIGSVGRFHPDKQYDVLIRSFVCVAQKYDHARLLLMGSGPQDQHSKSLRKSLGWKIKLFSLLANRLNRIMHYLIVLF